MHISIINLQRIKICLHKYVYSDFMKIFILPRSTFIMAQKSKYISVDHIYYKVTNIIRNNPLKTLKVDNFFLPKYVYMNSHELFLRE